MAINQAAVIAVNHFGLGARPGELAHVNDDPRGWLIAQVNGERAGPAAISQLPLSAKVFQTQVEFLREKKLAKQVTTKQATATIDVDPQRRVIRDLYLAQVAARYQVATHSSESFRERLIHFWTNHFAVSADKFAVLALAGTLENEAIRPNVGNYFYNMLLAVEAHPAMILYLDNQASIGPNSQLAEVAARRVRREGHKVDINENLAREILELHTLGVNGGYTQADVTTFARVLTGWSVGGGQGRLSAGEPGKFVFRDAFHEPGSQVLLGKRYKEVGADQVLAVLKDLSRHPATAHFIATKLTRHFIADDPPVAVVERIAKVFRDTDGYLPSVHRALVTSAEAWQQVSPKFKTPHEYVVSTFRAFDIVPEKPQQVLAPFELLGQRPYSPGSPAGWADIAGQWDGSDALMKRIEWATQVAQRVGGRAAPLEMAQLTLGDALGEHTQMAIANAADAAQGITLWLVSPEFQRR